MPSPSQIREQIPGDIDEFIYALHRWVVDQGLFNKDIIHRYLLKIYHAFVYVLTLHRISWRKVKSFRYTRHCATAHEGGLVATSNTTYRDAFDGEFLEGKKPQPPANFVVEMFELLFAERQKETQLLRFFGGLQVRNYFKPTIFCKADYSRESDKPVHAKGVNVACDDATRRKFRDNLQDNVLHPVIFECYESPPTSNGLHGLRWNKIRCAAVLVPSWGTGRGKPRPPCRRCYRTFPGVIWRPKLTNTDGRDQFPVGNCAEACAFSKLLFEAQVPGYPPNTLEEDERLKQTYEKQKKKFDLVLEKRLRT